MVRKLKFPDGPGGHRLGVMLTDEQKAQVRLQGTEPAGGRVQRIVYDPANPPPPPWRPSPEVRRITSSQDVPMLKATEAWLSAAADGSWEDLREAYLGVLAANNSPHPPNFAGLLQRTFFVLAARRRGDSALNNRAAR